MVENRAIALIYRFLLVGCCLYGILLYSGILASQFKPQIFFYFTILSVLLSLFYFSSLIIFMLRSRFGGERVEAPVAFFRFKGGVTLAVMITMLVYSFLLAPIAYKMSGYQPFTFPDIIIHYVIPIMIIFDWVLFDKGPTYVPSDPIKWLAIPLTYFVAILIRAQFGPALRATNSKYPYYFIDIDKLGILAVGVNALMLAMAFLAIGYLIFLADRYLPRRRHR